MHRKKTLTREEARELDRIAIEEFKIPSIALMENAGQRVAEHLLSYYQGGQIVICCGKGNNGGDGFVVARYLDNHHLPVHVLLFSDPKDLTDDAKLNYYIANKSGLMLTIVDDNNFKSVISTILPTASWIVDALFGTGLQGKVGSPFDRVIQAINDLKCSVVSIDIPSGLDCNSGESTGTAIQATHTITFTFLKKGFTNIDAKKFLGEVYIADIGIPKILLTENTKSKKMNKGNK